MATSSLSVRGFSSNDISELAHILEINIQHYCIDAKNSLREKEYHKTLRTIVGLGYAAVLVDGCSICTYNRHLDIFLRYCEFKQHKIMLPSLSRSIAEMIVLASAAFAGAEHSGYYEDFVIAVKKAIDNINSTMMGEGATAERLLKKLPRSLGWLFN